MMAFVGLFLTLCWTSGGGRHLEEFLVIYLARAYAVIRALLISFGEIPLEISQRSQRARYV